MSLRFGLVLGLIIGLLVVLGAVHGQANSTAFYFKIIIAMLWVGALATVAVLTYGYLKVYLKEKELFHRQAAIYIACTLGLVFDAGMDAYLRWETQPILTFRAIIRVLLFIGTIYGGTGLLSINNKNLTIKQKKRVLIAEDEELVQRLFTAVLSKDYEVTIVDTAALAIDKILNEEFDVFILDWKLNGRGDAGDIIAVLQNSARLHSALVVTGNADTLTGKVRKLGIEVLLKPVSTRTLLFHVQRLVEEGERKNAAH